MNEVNIVLSENEAKIIKMFLGKMKNNNIEEMAEVLGLPEYKRQITNSMFSLCCKLFESEDLKNEEI